MAARHPPPRSTSAASNSSRQQQQQQQQQQQPQPPLRRTLFSGSLSRRPATTSSSTIDAQTQPQPQTQTPYMQAASTPFPPGRGPSTAASSGFTPAPAFDSLPPAFVYGVRSAAAGLGQADASEDEDVEDDEIIVVESGSEGYGKRAASEKELLMVCLEEAAADGWGGEEGEGGDGSGKDDSARLIELYRSHARQRIDPNELKPAVEESLRKKVASLDEDKWIYEVESDSEEP